MRDLIETLHNLKCQTAFIDFCVIEYRNSVERGQISFDYFREWLKSEGINSQELTRITSKPNGGKYLGRKSDFIVVVDGQNTFFYMEEDFQRELNKKDNEEEESKRQKIRLEDIERETKYRKKVFHWQIAAMIVSIISASCSITSLILTIKNSQQTRQESR